MDWSVSVTGTDWSDEEDDDGEDVHVGDAFVSIVPTPATSTCCT
jgi:hypothetical protein